MAVRYSVNVDLLLTHLRLALGTGGCETGRGAGAIAPGKRIGTTRCVTVTHGIF